MSWLILLGCTDDQAEAEISEPQPPNIILIVADDLGWADVSTYGLDRVPTPNIDRIAEQGVAFTHGYVSSPACAPSRAALMTGQYPQSFGFEYNMFPQDGTRGLALDRITMADALKAEGYETALIGKWHQGVTDAHYPTERGFDEFYGFLSGTTTYVAVDTPGIVNAKPEQAPETEPRDEASALYTGADKVRVENFDQYLTSELTREAANYVRRDRDQPFFLYLAHHAPHRPFQAPQAYYDRFDHIEDHDRRVYVAMIAAMDDGIGELLDALEEAGQSDNTMVVFLSDNGCPARFEVCDCSARINGGKFTHLEGGIRVPFMMSWPAGLNPQGRVDTPVTALDLYPTFLAAAGEEEMPERLAGLDLVAALQDDTRDEIAARSLFWRQRPVSVIRQGDWKLVQVDGEVSGEETDSLTLFNLSEDPDELNNRAPEFPERAATMQAELSNWSAQQAEPSWPKFLTREVNVCGRATQAVY
ncbi:MAG: sulfatase-like hydrolase/transferase [Pseudomonadota bacterium]